MNEINFEGTLVLEKLAEIDKVDSFYEAIDADNFSQARSLMKQANVDEETINIVLQKMRTTDGNY